jgi:hypothetical protein
VPRIDPGTKKPYTISNETLDQTITLDDLLKTLTYDELYEKYYGQKEKAVEPEVEEFVLLFEGRVIVVGRPCILFKYLHLLQIFTIQVLKVRCDIPHQS